MMMLELVVVGIVVVGLLCVVIGSAVVYALARRPRFRQTSPTQYSQTPSEILKARYASGEINREEFEQVRQALEG